MSSRKSQQATPERQVLSLSLFKRYRDRIPDTVSDSTLAMPISPFLSGGRPDSGRTAPKAQNQNSNGLRTFGGGRGRRLRPRACEIALQIVASPASVSRVRVDFLLLGTDCLRTAGEAKLPCTHAVVPHQTRDGNGRRRRPAAAVAVAAAVLCASSIVSFSN